MKIYSILCGLLLVQLCSAAHPAVRNGASQESDFIAETLRIINGMKVENIRQFPYVAYVSVEFLTGPPKLCTGFVLDKKMVVTAAHCIPETHDRIAVCAGTLEAPVEEEKCVFVKGVHIHPGHVSGTIHHDIAVLELEAGITTKKVKPIMVGFKFPADAERVHSVGFGVTKSSRSVGEELHQIRVRIRSGETCKLLQRVKNRVDKTINYDEHVCAIARNPSKLGGICLGDSGGPLVIRGETRGQDHAIGVASFIMTDDDGGCDVTKPTVYATFTSKENSKFLRDVATKLEANLRIFHRVPRAPMRAIDKTWGKLDFKFSKFSRKTLCKWVPVPGIKSLRDIQLSEEHNVSVSLNDGATVSYISTLNLKKERVKICVNRLLTYRGTVRVWVVNTRKLRADCESKESTTCEEDIHIGLVNDAKKEQCTGRKREDDLGTEDVALFATTMSQGGPSFAQGSVKKLHKRFCIKCRTEMGDPVEDEAKISYLLVRGGPGITTGSLEMSVQPAASVNCLATDELNLSSDKQVTLLSVPLEENHEGFVTWTRVIDDTMQICAALAKRPGKVEEMSSEEPTPPEEPKSSRDDTTEEPAPSEEASKPVSDADVTIDESIIVNLKISYAIITL